MLNSRWSLCTWRKYPEWKTQLLASLWKTSRALEGSETALCFVHRTERAHVKGNFQKIVTLFITVDLEAFLLPLVGEDGCEHAHA